MMATGLKDKDGVEIYEGDICYWERDGYQGVFTVKLDIKNLRWIGECNSSYDDLEDFKDDYLKVLGNIYEGV